jgi:hypothetical protein
MSAATTSQQVRRTAPAAPARSAQPSQQPARAPMRAVPAFAFAASSADDEIKLHLNDIPRVEETMDVEGFKPSLLSRLFDLFAPNARN